MSSQANKKLATENNVTAAWLSRNIIYKFICRTNILRTLIFFLGLAILWECKEIGSIVWSLPDESQFSKSDRVIFSFENFGQIELLFPRGDKQLEDIICAQRLLDSRARTEKLFKGYYLVKAFARVTQWLNVDVAAKLLRLAPRKIRHGTFLIKSWQIGVALTLKYDDKIIRRLNLATLTMQSPKVP